MTRSVLMVGLGGAGQRHLRMLKSLLPPDVQYSTVRRHGETPLLASDLSVAGPTAVEEAHGLRVFPDLDAALANPPDLTVVATPTALHPESATKAALAGSSVLLEKPWGSNHDGFSLFRRLVLKQGLNFCISFQRRYHPLIQRLRQTVISGMLGDVVSAAFETHSNLPSWHPYEDWRTMYAARQDLGGGVILTESHDIDLAEWIFGIPTQVYATGGNWSNVPMEVEDTAQLQLSYQSFSVQLSMSFMAGCSSRRICVVGTEGAATWVSPGNLLIVNGVKESNPSYSNDDMFVAQAHRLLNSWSPGDTRSALHSAEWSLGIALAARQSMESGRPQTPRGASS